RMNQTPLWTLDAMVRATGGRVAGSPAPAIRGISIDTRTLEKGDAFFAIKGDRVDGHDYVTKAVAGDVAVAVVSEARFSDMPKDAPLLVVSDVLKALQALARAARE